MQTMQTPESTVPAAEAAFGQLAKVGLPVWEQFKTEEIQHPMEVTTALLMKILQDNKDTEYGKKYDFANIHSIEEYQRKVPVTVYDHYAPYIERMVKGESNLIVVDPVGHFNTTSGTVGSRKRIPLTDAQTAVFMKYNQQIPNGMLTEKLGMEWTKGRALCTSEGNAEELDNGITIGCASSRMAKVIQGGAGAMDTMMRTMYTSPLEAMFPGTENDTKYLHCRFALMEKDLRGIVTGFFSCVTLLLRYIEDNWRMLVDDIEKGTIDPGVRVTDEYRASLASKMPPMPERAAQLRAIFSQGFDEPFIPKVWPNMMYIQGVGGASFAVFDRIIKERYSGGCLHNLYSGITASEGLWTVPYDLEHTDSVIAPGSAFLEFLDVDAGDDFTQCLTLDKLEEGKIYEILVTNLCGFYRYRTRDAVKVVGKFGNTPTVEFMFRVDKNVNLVAEKTTEAAISHAVMKTAERTGITLVDYTLHPNVDTQKPRYDFYFETTELPKASQMPQLRQVLEEEMGKANPSFKGNIEKNNLLPPQLRIQQPETYLLYRDIMVMKGSTPSQLKPVHVTGNPFQEKFFTHLIEEELPE